MKVAISSVVLIGNLLCFLMNILIYESILRNAHFYQKSD